MPEYIMTNEELDDAIRTTSGELCNLFMPIETRKLLHKHLEDLLQLQKARAEALQFTSSDISIVGIDKEA